MRQPASAMRPLNSRNATITVQPVATARACNGTATQGLRRRTPAAASAINADKMSQHHPDAEKGAASNDFQPFVAAPRNRKTGGSCTSSDQQRRRDADRIKGERHAPLEGADGQKMRRPDACSGAATRHDEPERAQLSLLPLRERVRLHRRECAGGRDERGKQDHAPVELIHTNVYDAVHGSLSSYTRE